MAMAQAPKVINFMRWRMVATAFSAILLLASIGSLAINGLKLGLDFTGGTQIEVGFETPPDLEQIRRFLGEQGLQNPVAVFFGSDTEVLIRTQSAMGEGAQAQIERALSELAEGAALETVMPAPRDAGNFAQVLIVSGVSARELRQAGIFPAEYYGNVNITEAAQGVSVAVENPLDIAFSTYLLASLSQETGVTSELRRSEFVGPHIGEELRDQGGLGLLVALVVVMLYVAFRFQYKFSFGAVAALAHDVIVVVGIFSLLQLDFDLTVLAAVLAVIGYSLNDTIVVSDRIRENFRKLRKSSPEEIINESLTQMLERTLITSLTTLLVLFTLYLFGGELINNFAFALIIGVIVGTYSSIYVSSNAIIAMNINREDLIPQPREGEEQETQPGLL